MDTANSLTVPVMNLPRALHLRGRASASTGAAAPGSGEAAGTEHTVPDPKAAQQPKKTTRRDLANAVQKIHVSQAE